MNNNHSAGDGAIIDKLIHNHKILICAGSGGVGKTTMSAAIAVRGAELGKKVLVLTIDPAKRLATALGLDDLSSEEILVPNQKFKGELWASVVDSKKVFDDFVVNNVPDKEECKRILDNRLYKQLSTTLSGSQEYTSLEKLLKVTKDEKYDLVVLDTPPAQHAVDFLRAPQKMYQVFQNSIVKWFLPKSTSTTGFVGFFDRSTKAVIHAMESLTGSAFLEELREFFYVIRSLREVIQEHSAEIHRILTGTSSTFIVVTSFDEIKIKEARLFQKLLMSTGYSLSAVIINRAFPIWSTKEDRDINIQAEPLFEKIKTYYEELKGFFVRHQIAFDEFSKEVSGELDVVRVPDFDQDIYDLESIKNITDELVRQNNGGVT